MGGTALHFAAWRGDAEMVRDILTFHPSLELADQAHGGTPIGWALHGSMHSGRGDRGDYPGTVFALLAAGAKPPATEDVDASVAVKEVLRRHAQAR
jgi:hypothetical protein